MDKLDAVRIVLADPDTLVREGLRALAEGQPGMEVVGQASDGLELLAEMARLSPDVLVTEADLPKADVLELIPRLMAGCPGLRVLVVSGVVDRVRATALLNAGVTGYLPKSATSQEFLRAIRSVKEGDLVLHAVVGRAFFGAIDSSPKIRESLRALDLLTEREREVVDLVKHGYSNKEIGQRLYLSVHTVEVHLRNIYSKLGVRSRLQAAVKQWTMDPTKDT